MNYQDHTLQEIRKMDPNSLAYIGAPYTARKPDGSYDDAVMEQRIELVSKCMGKLMLMGVIPTSPLLMHLVRMHTKELPGDWNTWARYSTITMDKCDYMIVLEMEGTAESVGVNAEREHMEATGKPIFFLNVDEFLTEPQFDGIQVLPCFNDGASITPHPEGPNADTNAWSVYGRLLNGSLKWLKTVVTEEEATPFAQQAAHQYNVPIAPQPWKENPVTAFQVVPFVTDGDQMLPQYEGPTDATEGWAVYGRLASGEVKFVGDYASEEEAMNMAVPAAAGFSVEIEPQPWKTKENKE